MFYSNPCLGKAQRSTGWNTSAVDVENDIANKKHSHKNTDSIKPFVCVNKLASGLVKDVV